MKNRVNKLFERAINRGIMLSQNKLYGSKKNDDESGDIQQNYHKSFITA